MSSNTVIFWHRRDLRWHDNTGLHAALETERNVLPVFIFDSDILDKLEEENDARVHFIHRQIQMLDEFYRSKGSQLLVFYGNPLQVFHSLVDVFAPEAVFTNEDYEPYARARDKSIHDFLESHGVAFHALQDHVIMHPGAILKDDGKPYVVYTPFSRKWRNALTQAHSEIRPSAEYYTNFLAGDKQEIPTLEDMGFRQSNIEIPDKHVASTILKNYGDTRNFPAIPGTSRLGVHLRFGTISIRDLLNRALPLSDTYVNELIWREFYQQILWHFPRVVEENFHRKYDAIEWRNNEEEYALWCEGKTGYPIVDAGMRELNETGYMHNRVRMIVASFLTKHLLIDWRWGEAYFARKLLDFELASNNGGWQWAAGTGTDAQPYFRIFNPYSQTDKFDKQHEYINRWAPDSKELQPIVEHSFARNRALDTYKAALG